MSKNKHFRREEFRSPSSSNFSAQHLLIHKGLVQDMIKLAKINSNDTVVDIGAGTGAITLPLAKAAGNVLAIESDPAFVDKLTHKLKEETNVRIRQANILQMVLPKAPFTVVANIPYSITTPILGKLLDQPTVPLQRAVLLVEKGAAKRFTSKKIVDPRILVWRLWFDIRLLRTVSPIHFSPPPRVDSAVITIIRRKQPAVASHHYTAFMALAAHGLRFPNVPFSSALTEVFTAPQLTKLARALGIDRGLPICQLTEEQWGEVFLAMRQHVPSYRWPKMPKNHRLKKMGR